MAERKRSKDGVRETEKIVNTDSGVQQQGREGGNLQRDVATQDEKKRSTETPAGATRVTGEDKRKHGEDE